MNHPPMNNPMNNAPIIPVDSASQQKKKKPAKPKATNGSTTATGAKRGRKKKVGDDKKCNKKKFGKKGVTVTSQAREIVYNVIKHFKKEAQQKCNSHPFENWLKRSVAATGLSKSTLQRIIKEVEKPAEKIPQEVMNPMPKEQHNNPPHPPQHAEILVSQTLEAVKLEQYEQGLIKHFASNFMHHNLHHHHPMNPHHPELLLQPIHHAPMPPPPQPPPPPPPIHPHSHNSHTHIHL